MLTRKCQWISVALLTLCFALPTPSWALGLGEIDVSSALNERFVGTIELLDSEGFQSAEIVVSMASREDFQRVGVERFFYLTNLKFEVDTSGSAAVINVSSSQPVSEPYLNFIVEVLWPRGRLLKEYTVLLDPPTFSQAAAPAVSAPSQTVAQTPAPQPATTARPATQVRVAPSSRPAPARRAPVDGLMTSRDDTLWKIAQRTRVSEAVTINQQMLAIQRKNPAAFMRGNINLLKAGYVLDIPSESEALGIGVKDANLDVAAQTADWRSGRDRTQVASTDNSATQLVDDSAEPSLRSQVSATDRQPSSSGAASETEGQVRIVANTGELATGTATGEDASVNQLIEEKDTLARQVDELTYQLDREKEIATNQVTVKERQLEVKDQELAALQEQMKEMREQLAAAAQNQNQSANAAPAAETPWWMSPMVLGGVIGVLLLILVYALFALRKSKGVQANTYLEDEPVYAETETAYEAAEVAEPVEQVSALDIDDDEQSEEAVEPYIGDLEEDEYPADEYGEDDDSAPADAENEAEEGEEGSQTGDVIGEAEIYIAYGRYGQAANLLSGVLSQEPERWDVRLKLMEVYVESHDESSFATQAQYILDNCDDEDVLLACRDLEAQLDSGTVDMSADTQSAEQDLGLEPQAQQSGSEAVEDFDLDLDDFDAATEADTEDGLELDALEDVAELSDSAASEAERSEEVDAGIDFELEFDDDAEPEASAEEALVEAAEDAEEAGAGEELGGDLGINFDPDRDTAIDESISAAADEVDLDAEAPAAQSADDDLDLDAILEDVETEDAVVTAPAEPAVVETGADEADDFEFEGDGEGDINATKLDLAEAYVDMGDADGAQDILKEVLEEGSPEQQQKAQEMLDSIPS